MTKKELITTDPAPTALAIQTAATRELTPAIWRMISEMAPVLAKSRMLGVIRTEEAAAIMLKGFEMGLSMSASFDFIKVILGKTELIPRGALAIIHGSPLIKEITITRLVDDKEKFLGYICTMTRNNGFSYTSKFTMDMARKAGLVKQDSAWEKYEENMCLWRAVGFTADVVAPDVTAGMTTLMKAPEMYGVALTEGGDVIEAVATPSVDPLQELIDKFGAEKILSVYGKVPNGTQEINDAWTMLEGTQ
jgi:hypothetical protein